MVVNTLKVYCDGGARGNPGPAAAAFVVVADGGRVVAQKGIFLGRATNNVAEYNAVLLALHWTREHKKSGPAIFYLDSELIVNQLSGKFRIRNKTLQGLAAKIKNLEKVVGGDISYHNIRRSQNKLADFLVNKTLNTRNE